MVIGITFTLFVPRASVVNSTNAVARSLCWDLRCAARMVSPMLAINRTTPLARKALLRYKFIGIITLPMHINDKAPDFALANEDGQTVSSKDYRGKNLVLFFFPKANTPG